MSNNSKYMLTFPRAFLDIFNKATSARNDKLNKKEFSTNTVNKSYEYFQLS